MKEIFFLNGKVFNNLNFSDFTLRPTKGHLLEMLNVRIECCTVSSGTCVIRKGVSLKNVVFSEFDCGDALHISSEVCMDNVQIVGKKNPAMLWVRPQEDSDQPMDAIGNSLDISKFEGEVSITGLPSSAVIRNPETQIVVAANLLQIVDWKGLGISPLSCWKRMAVKVVADKSIDGIFSLPSRNGRNYERSISELKILKKSGYIN